MSYGARFWSASLAEPKLTNQCWPLSRRARESRHIRRIYRAPRISSRHKAPKWPRRVGWNYPTSRPVSPVPRVIERLQVEAGALPDVVLPQAEVLTTATRAPAPQTIAAEPGDVYLNCSSTQFTLWVKRDFYGFTVKPSELTLGRTCKSTGVDESSGDLMFEYPLTSCDDRQEVKLLTSGVRHQAPEVRLYSLGFTVEY